MEFPHKPVLLAETIAALRPKEAGRYLDGTLGLGGHSRAILESGPHCEVCGLDRDMEALAAARERLLPFGDRFHGFHNCFADFGESLNALGWESIDGALLDLGVSSLQLDKAERGFSFRGEARLDMRMDRSGGKSAWDLVNRESFDFLKNCIETLGEEPRAGRIARNIVTERAKAPIDDTKRLADVVWHSYPPAWRKSARNHPATRTFQALRMAVNGELEQLRLFLENIMPALAEGGILVIISFHSLEDRLVKHAMRQWAKGGSDSPALARILYKKPLVAGEEECAANPRARSAKLRAAEKLPEAAR